MFTPSFELVGSTRITIDHLPKDLSVRSNANISIDSCGEMGPGVFRGFQGLPDEAISEVADARGGKLTECLKCERRLVWLVSMRFPSCRSISLADYVVAVVAIGRHKQLF